MFFVVIFFSQCELASMYGRSVHSWYNLFYFFAQRSPKRVTGVQGMVGQLLAVATDNSRSSQDAAHYVWTMEAFVFHRSASNTSRTSVRTCYNFVSLESPFFALLGRNSSLSPTEFARGIKPYVTPSKWLCSGTYSTAFFVLFPRGGGGSIILFIREGEWSSRPRTSTPVVATLGLAPRCVSDLMFFLN